MWWAQFEIRLIFKELIKFPMHRIKHEISFIDSRPRGKRASRCQDIHRSQCAPPAAEEAPPTNSTIFLVLHLLTCELRRMCYVRVIKTRRVLYFGNNETWNNLTGKWETIGLQFSARTISVGSDGLGHPSRGLPKRLNAQRRPV